MSRYKVTQIVRDPREPVLPTDEEVEAALVRQTGESVPTYLPYGECLTGMAMAGAERRLLFDGDRIIGVVLVD